MLKRLPDINHAIFDCGSDSFEASQNIKKNCSNQVIHIIHEFCIRRYYERLTL